VDAQLVTDFVTADADRRSEGRHDPRRLCAAGDHRVDRTLNDARRSATPARVDRGSDVCLLVHEQDRHAIGRLDRHEQAGLSEDGGIAHRGSVPRSLDDRNTVHLGEKEDATDRREQVKDGASTAFVRNAGRRRQPDLKTVAQTGYRCQQR